MRIIKETNLAEFKLTMYFWNNKYLLKFENGRSEIMYKINQLDIVSEADVEVFLNDEDILGKIRECFEKTDETLDTFFAKI